MRVLITGGAGFIGSHLTDLLLNAGHKVTVLDDLSTGKVFNLSKTKDLQLEMGSVLDELLVDIHVKNADLVFHLAAVVGVKEAFKDPLKTLKVNVTGTENVLRSCAGYGKRCLITSSSEVYGYGNNGNRSLKETDACYMGSPATSLRWAYGTSKLLDEFLALSLYNSIKLPVTVVRLFNVVGPRQTGRYGMVLPRFINQALKNEPITVYGTGEQTRSFAYVREVVEALYELICCEDSIGEVANVASLREISILDLAQKVKYILGSSSDIRLVSYKEAYGEGFDDSLRRFANTKRLRNLIGWTPKMPLNEIVKITTEWMSHEMRTN